MSSFLKTLTSQLVFIKAELNAGLTLTENEFINYCTRIQHTYRESTNIKNVTHHQCNEEHYYSFFVLAKFPGIIVRTTSVIVTFKSVKEIDKIIFNTEVVKKIVISLLSPGVFQLVQEIPDCPEVVKLINSDRLGLAKILSNEEGDPVEIPFFGINPGDLTKYQITSYLKQGHNLYDIYIQVLSGGLYCLQCDSLFEKSIENLTGLELVMRHPDSVGKYEAAAIGYSCETAVNLPDKKINIRSFTKGYDGVSFYDDFIKILKRNFSLPLSLPIKFIEDSSTGVCYKNLHVAVSGVPGGGPGCVFLDTACENFDFNSMSNSFLNLTLQSGYLYARSVSGKLNQK